MQPRRAVAASLLVLVVACALLPPSEAFWSWKKKDTDVEIEHTEKGADVEHTVDSLDFDNNIHTLEEDSNAQIGEEIDNLHTISEEQVNSDLPDSYWFNEVTGQSQWDEPHYEFIDDEGRAYFVDPETYEHLWEKPASLSWEVKVNEAGEAYYHNTATGDSTSNKPAMYGWSKAAVHTEL